MSKTNISSVSEKTLKVLMLFSKSRTLSVSEIAEKTGMNISSAYRIVNTLSNESFILPAKEGEYTLNAAVIMSLYNMVSKDLREHVKPILKKIAVEIQASLYLSKIHNENQIIVIEKEDSPGKLRWVQNIGYIYDIPTGTAGKTHLAYILQDLDIEERKEYIKELNLIQFTSNSIIDRDILLNDINEILSQGYCMTEGEHLEGVTGISVPVLDYNGTNCIYVLTMIMPNSQFDSSQKSNIINQMRKAASLISKYTS
ncbi:hypothetical protein GCM10008931_44960 [Oceanobacillus oncorhynchi subsp. oncorhynchi]|uniref:IclR family transcriptional regulator n=1 Tax=Oceanobacillus oncorhynchi TaxID=545501 RepID=UPI0031E173C3